MSTLYLIRHGKASPGTDDYDQLHALGARQAELLGAHFARDAVRFDGIYVGPLKRQVDTWLNLQRGAGELAQAWPEPQTLDGLTEAPFEELARHMVLTRVGRDVELTRLLTEMHGVGADKERLSPLVMQVMVHMNVLWQRAELVLDGVETAVAFRDRLSAALRHMLDSHPGEQRVLAITSNGVVGGMLECAEPSGSAVPLFPVFHNASVSVVEADGAGLHVVARDLTNHLTEAELLTKL